MQKNMKIGAIIGGGLLAWLFWPKSAQAATNDTRPLYGPPTSLFTPPPTAKPPTVVNPTGDVILGAGTVTGPSATAGGTDYLTEGGNPYTPEMYPGQNLPDKPDYYNSDGSPGYFYR
jgi:hypothetical protein